MLRRESLSDITDGRKYGLNDMVKADAFECKGCSKCCETMADTIVLSPLDIYRLKKATGKSFAELTTCAIELNMQDGIILPNIKASDAPCPFLVEKRCSIHENRPDFCRLFPLGRLYEDGDFSYILQSHDCEMPRAKVKVKKWIDISDYDRNREYILTWHDIVVRVREITVNGDEKARGILVTLLQLFYQDEYDLTEDFYQQFFDRVEEFREIL